MGLIPWVFGFTLLFSLVGWMQFRSLVDHTVVQQAVLTVLEEQSQAYTDKVTADAIHNYATLCPQASEYEENRQHSSQRLTRKLHLPTLFSSKEGHQKEVEERVFYRLLELLYPTMQERAAVFELVREKAIEWEEHFPIKKARYLANIELSEAKDQDILFRILKGGAHDSISLDSLLPYISTTARTQLVSVYLAPQVLLLALFDDEEVVSDILSFRKDLYHRLRKDKDLQKNELEDEFRERFVRSLPSEIDPSFIDFRVSRSFPKDQ